MPVKIDQIVRTKRKTITLVVNSEAELIIRAPLHTPIHVIEEIVEKRLGWIAEKQKAVTERNNRHLLKQFQEGESFLFLGLDYTLAFSPNVQEITANNGYLLIPNGLKDVKQSLVVWYKKEAGRVIKDRLNLFLGNAGLTCKTVKITGARKRWGSCGSNGTLNFSWRLVMCPIPVIDYVIVHEISHLKHHNHSRDFWQSVQITMPDYKRQKAWLRENQRLMDVF